MLHRLQVKQLTTQRKSALLTLAIAAIIHETNEAVQETAQILMETYPEGIVKSLLKPLTLSHSALDVVVDEAIYPVHEKELGHVTYGDYQYAIVVTYREYLDYTVEQIVHQVAMRFVQRGIVDGRLFVKFDHPHYRHDYSTSVDLAEFSRYSRVEHEQAA